MGGENDERIQASHGAINVQTQVGRFYDVTGSVGLRQSRAGLGGCGPAFGVYQRQPVSVQRQAGGEERAAGVPDLRWNSDVVPVAEAGLAAVCLRVQPGWGEGARARQRLPCEEHAAAVAAVCDPSGGCECAAERDSDPGDWVRLVEQGETIGEQVYWAINRSTELTVGTIFYSARGWEQTASFQYRGLGRGLLRRRTTADCGTADTIRVAGRFM